jgi:hypothetical protein
MIAEYQVDKLRHRLSERVTGPVYRSFSSMKKHLHILSNIMANGTSFQLK